MATSLKKSPSLPCCLTLDSYRMPISNCTPCEWTISWSLSHFTVYHRWTVMPSPGQGNMSQLPKFIKKNCSQPLWLPWGVKVDPTYTSKKKKKILIVGSDHLKINHRKNSPLYTYQHIIVTDVSSIIPVPELSSMIFSQLQVIRFLSWWQFLLPKVIFQFPFPFASLFLCLSWEMTRVPASSPILFCSLDSLCDTVMWKLKIHAARLLWCPHQRDVTSERERCHYPHSLCVSQRWED